MNPTKSNIALILAFLMGLVLSGTANAADRSTPKNALLSLVSAVESGNSKEYLETFQFATNEMKFKQVLERSIQACGKLKIAVQKFGTNATVLPPFPISLPRTAVERSTEKIVGNNAFVDVGKTQPIEMIKEGASWKITVAGFFHRDAESLSPMVAAFAEGLERAGDGIIQGKYKSINQAFEAMKRGGK